MHVDVVKVAAIMASATERREDGYMAEELRVERERSRLDIEELTYLLDGGEIFTKRRRAMGMHIEVIVVCLKQINTNVFKMVIIPFICVREQNKTHLQMKRKIFCYIQCTCISVNLHFSDLIIITYLMIAYMCVQILLLKLLVVLESITGHQWNIRIW